MEIIRFGNADGKKPPLLFIHGSYCGAWVWTRFFLPAFAEAGWSGAAISLRGHGKSEGLESIDAFGIADFLEDIDAGAKLFERPPVLIGHSLGGYLAQKYALDKPVSGLVLLSSPSLLGLQGSWQYIATHRPMLAMQLGALMSLGPSHADLHIIADALFCNIEKAKKMGAVFEHPQRESSRVFLEASWPDFRTPLAYPPTLALGGDADPLVPEFEFRYEAHFWKGQSKILRGVSHGVMLDGCWTEVAGEVMGWLAGVFSPK